MAGVRDFSRRLGWESQSQFTRQAEKQGLLPTMNGAILVTFCSHRTEPCMCVNHLNLNMQVWSPLTRMEHSFGASKPRMVGTDGSLWMRTVSFTS